MPNVASTASAAPPSASASFARPPAAVQGRPSETPFSQLMDSTAPTDPPPAPSTPPPAPSAPPPSAASNSGTNTAAKTGNANNDSRNGAKNDDANNASSSSNATSASDTQAPTDASKGDAATAGQDPQATTTATADATGTVENATAGVTTTGGNGKDPKSKDSKDNTDGLNAATTIGAPAGPDPTAQAVAVAAATVPTPVVAAVIAPLTAPPAVAPTPTDGAAAAIAAATDGASSAGLSIPQSLLAGLASGQQKPGAAVPTGTPKPGTAPADAAQPEAAGTTTADATAQAGPAADDAAKTSAAARTTFADVLKGAQTPTKALSDKDAETTEKAGSPRAEGVGSQADKITVVPADTHVQTPVAPPTGDQNAASALQSLGASATAANNGMPGATPAATAATPAQAAAAAVATAVPIAGVAVEIVARAQAGSNHFEIRLDPPDLGRIDVRLNVDKQGNVTSHLVVDRSQTLDMLRSDAPRLERALQDAGLKTGSDGLQFSLRDQGAGAQNQNFQDGGPARTARITVPLDDVIPIETARSYGRLVGTNGGLDIRV